MFGTKKIACIIPARLNSLRFPQKILALLGGKPLLQWAWEEANKTTFFSDIVFAIDSEKTASVIKSFGGRYLMTSVDCKSGTDRLIEIMHTGQVEADIWVGWQADEPFVTPNMIKQLLHTCEHDIADVWTLKKRMEPEQDVENPNDVKVVCDVDGFALYFSRSVIPYYRDKTAQNKEFYQHIGLYAYTTEALRKISRLGHSYLEDAESLEQLRFLHHKMAIKVNETDQAIIGVNTSQDMVKAEAFARKLG